MNQKGSEPYQSTNLYECAFLYCRGAKLAGHSRDGAKTVLHFAGENVKDLSLEFYNGGSAPAKNLFDAYHLLRDYAFAKAR